MEPEFIQKAFENTLKELGFENFVNKIRFEQPRNEQFGDIATNIALLIGKEKKENPRKIAEDITSKLSFDPNLIDKISVDGPGFINIKLSNLFFTQELERMFNLGENYGKSSKGSNRKVNVEYVSANPTGLLHLGHGRNACIGDSIANLYQWLGYDVTREYYFNNAGRQMQILARSIYARYRQLLGEEEFPFPEDGYFGDYIKDIAKEIAEKFGDQYKVETAENLEFFKKYGENWCFEKIRSTLEKLNIRHDLFFNEDTLYSTGKINEVIDILKQKGLVYQKDGALWLAFTKLGLTEDRVIVKSSGEPTYRLPDIAYHRDKFERGFDLIVDILGSDHIATVPDVIAGLGALGYDTSKVKVVFHQFVTLTENGEQVKMSKRSGRSYTLDELISEVGPDVVRFFFLMRNVSSHLEFDLGLAREQSEKNPVYYLQYAYARICSIFDTAKERGIEFNFEANTTCLEHPQELNLIKVQRRFPEVIEIAAEKFEPQILADYLYDLATAFHTFYHNCRIIGSEEPILSARFKLAKVTQTILKNGLTILGVSAPTRM
ncbi:MAG: arginine--tRNA ligase [Ignavibacteria bacterium]|nr:arginine--tRNA ligase [Ignavibacteria bacterium]